MRWELPSVLLLPLPSVAGRLLEAVDFCCPLPFLCLPFPFFAFSLHASLLRFLSWISLLPLAFHHHPFSNTLPTTAIISSHLFVCFGGTDVSGHLDGYLPSVNLSLVYFIRLEFWDLSLRLLAACGLGAATGRINGSRRAWREPLAAGGVRGRRRDAAYAPRCSFCLPLSHAFPPLPGWAACCKGMCFPTCLHLPPIIVYHRTTWLFFPFILWYCCFARFIHSLPPSTLSAWAWASLRRGFAGRA